MGRWLSSDANGCTLKKVLERLRAARLRDNGEMGIDSSFQRCSLSDRRGIEEQI